MKWGFPYLFPVVKALVVIFEGGHTLLLAAFTLARVHHVATKDLLPEGVAAGATWKMSRVSWVHPRGRELSAQAVIRDVAHWIRPPGREAKEHIPPLFP